VLAHRQHLEDMLVHPLTKEHEMEGPERLLTSPEAAEYLAICERKLFTLTQSKEIRAILIPPRSVRYDPADLRDFILRCKRSDGE